MQAGPQDPVALKFLLAVTSPSVQLLYLIIFYHFFSPDWVVGYTLYRHFLEYSEWRTSDIVKKNIYQFFCLRISLDVRNYFLVDFFWRNYVADFFEIAKYLFLKFAERHEIWHLLCPNSVETCHLPPILYFPLVDTAQTIQQNLGAQPSF